MTAILLAQDAQAQQLHASTALQEHTDWPISATQLAQFPITLIQPLQHANNAMLDAEAALAQDSARSVWITVLQMEDSVQEVAELTVYNVKEILALSVVQTPSGMDNHVKLFVPQDLLQSTESAHALADKSYIKGHAFSAVQQDF